MQVFEVKWQIERLNLDEVKERSRLYWKLDKAEEYLDFLRSNGMPTQLITHQPQDNGMYKQTTILVPTRWVYTKTIIEDDINN